MTSTISCRTCKNNALTTCSLPIVTQGTHEVTASLPPPHAATRTPPYAPPHAAIFAAAAPALFAARCLCCCLLHVASAIVCCMPPQAPPHTTVVAAAAPASFAARRSAVIHCIETRGGEQPAVIIPVVSYHFVLQALQTINLSSQRTDKLSRKSTYLTTYRPKTRNHAIDQQKGANGAPKDYYNA